MAVDEGFAGAIRFYAGAANDTRSDQQMRVSDWTVQGSQGTGYSGGGGLKIGAGYSGLTLRKSQAPFVYDLVGGYVEGGLGAGLNISGEVTKLVAKRILNVLGSFSTDFLGAFPNFASPLYFGPKCAQGDLGAADFEGSTWLYINGNVASAAFAGDAGLLMLMDYTEYAKQFARGALPAFIKAGAVGEVENAVRAIYTACKAWCWYGGTALGFGVSVGIGYRVIRMTKFKVSAV